MIIVVTKLEWLDNEIVWFGRFILVNKGHITDDIIRHFTDILAFMDEMAINAHGRFIIAAC